MSEKMEQIKSFRLERLQIRNFKGIDSLDLEFTEPLMERDLDVMALGSANGVGKTSVLEAVSLLYLVISKGKTHSLGQYISFKNMKNQPLDVMDLLIRANATAPTSINAVFQVNESQHEVDIRMRRDSIHLTGKIDFFRDIMTTPIKHSDEMARQFFELLAGQHTNPILFPHLQYFHSYRKVREGNPELGMMMDKKARPYAASPFKLEVIYSMMGQAGLFENIKPGDAQESADYLNTLIQKYAGGTIKRLKTSSDSTVDIRITSDKREESYTFDGLSSGQKEIISTFFLIWKYSRNSPSIVLIDEPELHLNAEWRMGFIYQLKAIAPHNQYILATHDKRIFGSVPAERRILLRKEKESGK